MRKTDKTKVFEEKTRGAALELDVINLYSSRHTVLDRGLVGNYAVSQLKLVVSRLIRTVLWYSMMGFPCGFLIRWLCAHPDCSFVVRYDSVRPEELTRGHTG